MNIPLEFPGLVSGTNVPQSSSSVALMGRKGSWLSERPSRGRNRTPQLWGSGKERDSIITDRPNFTVQL